MTIEVIKDAQENVIPLSALLETPNEPEVDENTGDKNADGTEGTEGTEGEQTVATAAETVAQQIDEAKEAGASKDEINELRQMLRELRNTNISLQARLSAAERVQKGEFGTDGKDVEVSELEKYQEQLQAAAGRDFSEILAVMEVNPKYEDYREVCTGPRFEDIFEKVAAFRAEQSGSDVTLELMKVKSEVWSLPNPYKYMYDTIKAYHPDFKQTEKHAETVVAKPGSAKEVIQEKKPVVAPGTVANLGGGGDVKGGWTAERIDNLPENQLHTVPRDVYNKWLAGELD